MRAPKSPASRNRALASVALVVGLLLGACSAGGAPVQGDGAGGGADSGGGADRAANDAGGEAGTPAPVSAEQSDWHVDVCTWVSREIDWHSFEWHTGEGVERLEGTARSSDTVWDEDGTVRRSCDLRALRVTLVEGPGAAVEPTSSDGSFWVEQLLARDVEAVRVVPGEFAVQIDDSSALVLAVLPNAPGTTTFDRNTWAWSELAYRLLDAWEVDRIPTIERQASDVLASDVEGVCSVVGLSATDGTALLDDVEHRATAGPPEHTDGALPEFLCGVEPAEPLEASLYGDEPASYESWKRIEVLLTYAESESEADVSTLDPAAECDGDAAGGVFVGCHEAMVLATHSQGRWLAMTQLVDRAAFFSTEGSVDDLADPAVQDAVARIGAEALAAVASLVPQEAYGDYEGAVDPRISVPFEPVGDDRSAWGLTCEIGDFFEAVRTRTTTVQVCTEWDPSTTWSVVGELDGVPFSLTGGRQLDSGEWWFSAPDDGTLHDLGSDPSQPEIAVIVGSDGVEIVRTGGGGPLERIVREYPDERVVDYIGAS